MFSREENALTPSADVTWRDVDGELVVLNLTTGEYYTFNDVGRTVWGTIAAGENLTEVARRVANEHSLEVDAVVCDIKSFINGLVEQRLVKRRLDPMAQGVRDG